MKLRDFLQKLRDHEIVAAIQKAEKKTSGEIRVFISRKEIDDPVLAATEQFTRLGMSRTRERNGVLIYVAPRVRKFAVIGDRAVHEKCGEQFWKDLAEEMTRHFKDSHFTRGVVHGVTKAGDLLAAHFPCEPGDKNEMPDKVERD
jgi:uncharacterized membrane protein